MAKSALVPSGVQSRIQNPESSVQLRALRALWISVLSGGQAAISIEELQPVLLDFNSWILHLHRLHLVFFTPLALFFYPESRTRIQNPD